MATTKKPKSSKKKTSKKKKASKKKKKAAQEPVLMTPEKQLQLQVEQSAAALIKGIQDGEVFGLAIIAIGKDDRSDTLTISGLTPRHRLAYMLSLASHMNMANAIRNIQLANEQRVAEAQQS